MTVSLTASAFTTTSKITGSDIVVSIPINTFRYATTSTQYFYYVTQI